MKPKQITLSLLFIVLTSLLKAQMYFPPNNSNAWETTAPSELEWCQSKIDSLYSFLEASDSKAFILIKDGKIVLEQYFNGHTQADNWYWASAGKTLTATMVGIAQQENFLNIADTTSTYLGQGWTACTPIQEEKITIKHQLSMITGLDDANLNDCTDDTCLLYLADPETRWAYHNAPYTLLDQVIEAATGQSLNLYTKNKVLDPIGMNGSYIPVNYNNVFFSTARSMTRFGLLMLNEGNWNGTPILSDSTYMYDMTHTSQSINEAYGYLWWLNGENSFRLPQTQVLFPGTINASAPDDMFSAMGKNGQFINVIPSENMVWIRMGNEPNNTLVPFLLNEDIQKYINELKCSNPIPTDTTINSIAETKLTFEVYPNPTQSKLYIKTEAVNYQYQLYSMSGKLLKANKVQQKIDLSGLAKGIYYLKLDDGIHFKTVKVLKR